MDEQAAPIWMELQHVDGDAAQVLLTYCLQRERADIYVSVRPLFTAQTEAVEKVA